MQLLGPGISLDKSLSIIDVCHLMKFAALIEHTITAVSSTIVEP